MGPKGKVARGVGWLAPAAAERWPGREYLLYEGQRTTFSELSQRTDGLAVDLLRHGVAPGDRVLIQLPNGLDIVLLQLAAWRIGAVAVPVVSIYRERELRQIVDLVRPAVVATSATLGGRSPVTELNTVLSELEHTPKVRYVTQGSHDGWSALPEGRSRAVGVLPEPAAADLPCLLLFTSGTTGAPKAVELTSTALLEATNGWLELALTPDDVALAVGPLAHIGGMIPGCLVPLTVGCRVVVLPRWEPEVALRTIVDERVTYTTGAPVFLSDLTALCEQRGVTALGVEHFVCGGAVTPADLIRRADAVGIAASRGYGMTETAGLVALAPPGATLEQRCSFDGHVVQGLDVRAVDDAGVPQSPGTVGNLRIRGPQLLRRYTDEGATRAQLCDGWFDPGDVGRVLADGWLEIRGRTKDIINRGGEKFSARDIEDALTEHPAVLAAVVAPVPDPRFGEAVCAFLVLTRSVSPDELEQFLLDSQMTKAKVPSEWHVVEGLPTTATGKVRKNELLENRDRARRMNR